mmetsp:Transcript_94947/g.217485  ORF Transcript_94947/g.217485 Transcript_94947/m.217485 type:complete len:126 (+) Transcript_94947:179-556(+)
MLTDLHFLDRFKKVVNDGIPTPTLARLEKLMMHEGYQPEVVGRVSSAAKRLYMMMRAACDTQRRRLDLVDNVADYVESLKDVAFSEEDWLMYEADLAEKLLQMSTSMGSGSLVNDCSRDRLPPWR